MGVSVEEKQVKLSQRDGYKSTLTSTLVAWWNTTFKVFKSSSSGKGTSNTS